MRFVMEIDTERNPDAVGEYLRSEFFAENPDDPMSIGCYSVMEWREDVVEFPDYNELDEETGEVLLVWKCGKKRIADCYGIKENIECCWAWDGDGFLEFHFPNGEILENTDCKKNFGWELHK